MKKNNIKKYFKDIKKKVEKTLLIAESARKQNKDPVNKVETAIVHTLSERVVKLVSTEFTEIDNTLIVEEIEKLEKKYGPLDWRVGIDIAKKIAKNEVIKFQTLSQSIKAGIKLGFAYLTGGIVAAPLEGLVDIEIKKNPEGTKYLSLVYAGPIRGAGGTAAAVSVLIADAVRKELNLKEYKPEKEEILRCITEVYDYHERVSNLQYLPQVKELEYLLSKIPVQIDGEPTSTLDVSNYLNLERIKTNKIRGGVCLVLAEGLSQKAVKIYKRISKWENEIGWEFLKEFLIIQQSIKSKKSENKQTENEHCSKKALPNYTYLKDIVGGRPVFGMPMKEGGFRLRIGKTRLSGHSASAIHPLTAMILDDFIAYGTQLKLERPGKSTTITFCDSIEGPIVKLANGSVLKLENVEEKDLERTIKEIYQIIYLGDILINYGDFYENGQKLVPIGYCPEWWHQEAKIELQKDLVKYKEIEKKIGNTRLKKIFNNKFEKINFVEASVFSEKLKIPLHPDFIYYYSVVSKEELIHLFEEVGKDTCINEIKTLENKSAENKNVENKDSKGVFIESKEDIKKTLEKLGIEHSFRHNGLKCKGDVKKKIYVPFKNNFGFFKLTQDYLTKKAKSIITSPDQTILDFINSFSSFVIKDKAGTFVGARMGRPEKSKPRSISGSPNIIFPTIENRNKNILDMNEIESYFKIYYCKKCEKENLFRICSSCGETCIIGKYDKKSKETIYDVDGNKKETTNREEFLEYKKNLFDLKKEYEKINNEINKISKEVQNPEISVKGMQKLDNKSNTVEHFLKGISRASENLSVYKDGTMRYDMSECPIVTFKPSEIGTSCEALKKLGYLFDVEGNELKHESQTLELFPQDVILPSKDKLDEMQADAFLLKSSKVVDRMLKYLYGLRKYYNAKYKNDTIGFYVVVLAPHISCGTVARVVGYSENQVFLAHPYMHAAIRRDCDGDEACISLLMDVFLNFSREFLPDRIGARTMDVPLIMSTKITPSEIDDQVFGYDIVKNYSLELYNSSLKLIAPWEIKIKQVKDIVNTPDEFFNLYYTHSVSDMNIGNKVSSYKTIPSMHEKIIHQMDLARKINATDENVVAEMVLEKHMLKDLRGNFRKYFRQNFKCSECGFKFTKPTLMGVCTKCRKGKINLTVPPGSISKYSSTIRYLVENFNISNYQKEVANKALEDVFETFLLEPNSNN